MSWCRETPCGGDGERYRGRRQHEGPSKKALETLGELLQKPVPSAPHITAFLVLPELMIVLEEDDFKETEQGFLSVNQLWHKHFCITTAHHFSYNNF